MRIKEYFVYIVTNRTGRLGVLYIGVTNNLLRRYDEHRCHGIEGFTAKYKTDKLVYYERFFDVRAAIRREKQLKRWRRDKKIALIERENPNCGEIIIDVAKDKREIPRRSLP